jgi:DNA polymerase III delta subunit
MLLSKAYIRKQFMKMGIQMNDEALDLLCEHVKLEVKKYALNAKDLGYKRLTKDKVPITIGDYDNV